MVSDSVDYRPLNHKPGRLEIRDLEDPFQNGQSSTQQARIASQRSVNEFEVRCRDPQRLLPYNPCYLFQETFTCISQTVV